ncbi:hypothetical protein ACFMPD_17355 [Sedimentitalea sp. HM32M-2]|uniref:hypothetical protein n=1 Tax=Sedimentitalea sp. HM32M-2 TaxID=3351566 RepID=UPI003633F2FE
MQDPDITLFELRDALADAEGVTVHHSAIAGLLKRPGFAHKEVAPSWRICLANRLPVNGLATARRRAKARRQRDHWTTYRSPAISRMPDRIAFPDDTAGKPTSPGCGAGRRGAIG